MSDQSRANYAIMKNPNRALRDAVQDGEIVRQGDYRMLAVQGYRMGANGDPRLHYLLL